MTLTAKLYFSEDQAGPNGRFAERRPLQADATLRDGEARPVDISVIDLSTSGCLIESPEELAVPSLVTLGIAGIGRVSARIARRDGSRFGCAFVVPLSEEAVRQANAVDTVVTFPATSLPTPLLFGETAAPEEAKWPRPVRIAVLLGGAILAWAIVLALLL